MLQQGVSLELEAQKSEIDPLTGKVRCLSCGSVFRSRSALADHLRKHGGVNALSYQPRRVVGTSQGVFKHRPVERPADVQLSDLVPDAPTDASTRPKPESREGKTRRRAKMTPTKRTIMIHQVLSLTHHLAALHQDYASLIHPRCTDADNRTSAEQKKQMKKIQGCINAVASELQTVLTAVNRRFTFRQLVMIEYLTQQMEHLEIDAKGAAVVDCPSKMDDLCALETESLDPSLLDLYTEVEQLGQKLEEWRTAEADSLKHTEKRRDTESGKVFIKKPVFEESSLVPTNAQNCTQSDLANKESEGEVPQQETTSQKAENGRGTEVEGGYLSSLETSSDDSHELWGFGDVLAEWAKQTQRSSKNKTPIMPHTFQKSPETPQRDQCSGTAAEERESGSAEGGIRVVRASRTAGQTSEQKQDIGVSEWAEDTSHPGDSPQPRCVFIRPHLASLDEMHRDTTQRSIPKKSTPMKKRQVPAPGAAIAVTKPAEVPLNLDEAVHQLLTALNNRQHEEMKSNSRQRWIVSGFAEVCRHLSRGSLKLIIIANNLDPSIQPKISELTTESEKQQVPLVQALTRKKIGQIYHYRKRMSVVGVLNDQDQQTLFETVLRLSRVA